MYINYLIRPLYVFHGLIEAISGFCDNYYLAKCGRPPSNEWQNVGTPLKNLHPPVIFLNSLLILTNNNGEAKLVFSLPPILQYNLTLS